MFSGTVHRASQFKRICVRVLDIIDRSPPRGAEVLKCVERRVKSKGACIPNRMPFIVYFQRGLGFDQASLRVSNRIESPRLLES